MSQPYPRRAFLALSARATSQSKRIVFVACPRGYAFGYNRSAHRSLSEQDKAAGVPEILRVARMPETVEALHDWLWWRVELHEENPGPGAYIFANYDPETTCQEIEQSDREQVMFAKSGDIRFVFHLLGRPVELLPPLAALPPSVGYNLPRFMDKYPEDAKISYQSELFSLVESCWYYREAETNQCFYESIRANQSILSTLLLFCHECGQSRCRQWVAAIQNVAEQENQWSEALLKLANGAIAEIEKCSQHLHSREGSYGSI